jgi:hypothetical protein
MELGAAGEHTSFIVIGLPSAMCSIKSLVLEYVTHCKRLQAAGASFLVVSFQDAKEKSNAVFIPSRSRCNFTVLIRLKRSVWPDSTSTVCAIEGNEDWSQCNLLYPFTRGSMMLFTNSL